MISEFSPVTLSVVEGAHITLTLRYVRCLDKLDMTILNEIRTHKSEI